MLEQLLIRYNEKLKRYQNMDNWCNNTSHDEQLKQQANIYQVINECNDLINEISKYIPVTSDEIENGFDVKGGVGSAD